MNDDRLDEVLRAFLVNEATRAAEAAPPVEVVLDAVEDASNGDQAAMRGGARWRVEWLVAVLLLLLAGLLASIAVGLAPSPRSAANGLIAFVGRDHDIYVMAADGSESRRLTETDQWEYALAWSPDGKELAFARSPASFLSPSGVPSGDLQIVVLDIASGRERSVLQVGIGDELWGGVPNELAWSAGGDAISFGTDMNGPRFHIDLNGGAVTRIPGLLSPDGRQTLVATGTRPPAALGTGLYVAQFDTGQDPPAQDRVPVSDRYNGGCGWFATENICQRSAAWAPDGSLVAFLSVAPNPQTYTHVGNLDVVDVQGTANWRIADSVTDFAWSPDGQRLGYIKCSGCAGREGIQTAGGGDWYGELWVAARDGSGARQIADRAAGVGWSPDGSLLYYLRVQVTGPDAGVQLWAARLDDGNDPEQLPALLPALASDPPVVRVSWQVIAD